MIAHFSKEDLTWEYIQSKTSGIQLQPETLTPQTLSIPIDIIPTFDSALCFSEPSGKVSGKQILIRLKKGLCPDHPFPPLKIIMARPPNGSYTLRYDDHAVQTPILGRIIIP